ncbi:MAG: hypothetical protein ACI9CF_001789 [Candidatus Omnitrophota bacterium]|jgi:hypothetical protein
MLVFRIQLSLIISLMCLTTLSHADALPEPIFSLTSEGVAQPPDYTEWGRFEGVGKAGYEFVPKNAEALSQALGDFVYPNPLYSETNTSAAESETNVWDLTKLKTSVAIEEWIQAQSIPLGTRLFHAAEMLREAGHIRQAIKLYYALVIHAPKTVIWNKDGSFYWYAAPEAISRIRRLCAQYPGLGFELKGALVSVSRSATQVPENDEVLVWPGKIVPAAFADSVALDDSQIKKTLGGKRVSIVQFENDHWQLRVDNEPFIVKGMNYAATKIGESPHDGSLRPWMTVDDNSNGLNDGMFDSWIDANKNSIQDEDEVNIGDAQLLADLGVNAIRHYHAQDAYGAYNPDEYDKRLMRILNKDYGLYFIMADFLGAYTIGSGASWSVGTDYNDPSQREKMKLAVKAMVEDHRDEPYVLMWLLGNENQHITTKTNAHTHPKVYAKFVNEVALMIKELDPTRPVAICNLSSNGIRAIAKYAPAIDIYGANVYSGPFSMGSVNQLVRHYLDRPLMFTEWGNDAYFEGRGPDEAAQSEYILGNWEDMLINSYGRAGEGNVIGGVLFEWMDEWWKSPVSGGPWGAKKHDTQGDSVFPFKDDRMHEEWLGIVSQGYGKSSPYLREIRQAYRDLKLVWNPDTQVVDEDVFFEECLITSINVATGDFVVDVDQEDGSTKSMTFKVDPEEVSIFNPTNQDLYFEHLAKDDIVDVDCIRRNGELIVDTIFLFTIKQIEE